MDRGPFRPEFSERVESHWSMPFCFVFKGDLYGPMAMKARQDVPPKLALVHGWLFPVTRLRQSCSLPGGFPGLRPKKDRKNVGFVIPQKMGKLNRKLGIGQE